VLAYCNRSVKHPYSASGIPFTRQKALIKGSVKWSVVLVDVAESRVERPKKTSGSITTAKEATYPQDPTGRKQGWHHPLRAHRQRKNT